MSRKVGIAVSLVLALLFTALIVLGGNKAYREVSKTVDVLTVTRDIPANALIRESDVEIVSIPEAMAKKWLTDSNDAVGKVAAVAILKDSYISPHAVHEGTEMAEGHVSIMVAIDLASSAGAVAGDLVNVHVVDRDLEDNIAPCVIPEIKVLRAVISDGSDQSMTPDDGDDLVPGSDEAIAALSLEVPESEAETIVYYAAQKAVYLTKCNISENDDNGDYEEDN